MPIRLFNTYTRQEETLSLLDPAGREVKIYTCGPTVYDFAHIGNFRTFLFEDLLHRHLEARGLTVRRVMNLTDVDDKTIRNSRNAGIPLHQFTQTYKDAFFADLATLRIKPADHFPAATEPVHIARMIAMIRLLQEKDIAYQADDLSLYYRIARFPCYGCLAHLDLENLRPSGRINSDEYEKESLGDFALWKAWTPDDGDVAWDSPWGRGRPGWHIECSAMASNLLGDQLDIHCGGHDNIFPHHEAEIAQTEAITGRQYVRHWLHSTHLMVEGQKMSKSLGNFLTLRTLLEKGWTGREIRHALLSVHYRIPANFTLDGLAASRKTLHRLDLWLQRLRQRAGDTPPASPEEFPLAASDAFHAALDHDLNISAALGELFTTIRETNRLDQQNNLPPAHAAALLRWWENINHTLRLEPDENSAAPADETADETALPPEVAALLALRQTARDTRDWPASDRLRDQIKTLGYLVKDSKTGQTTEKIQP